MNHNCWHDNQPTTDDYFTLIAATLRISDPPLARSSMKADKVHDNTTLNEETGRPFRHLCSALAGSSKLPSNCEPIRQLVVLSSPHNELYLALAPSSDGRHTQIHKSVTRTVPNIGHRTTAAADTTGQRRHFSSPLILSSAHGQQQQQQQQLINEPIDCFLFKWTTS